MERLQVTEFQSITHEGQITGRYKCIEEDICVEYCWLVLLHVCRLFV